jgi:EpsD family peptidyl-prolyl cis-trans isomerase
LAGIAPMLSACGDKTPSGQVIATVNGIEVTRNELSTEPEMLGGAGEAALPKVLDGVIDRKLAVEEAKKLKLDQTREFIAQQQRGIETLLGQQLLTRWSNEAPQPKPSDISAFIASHPQIFSGHKVFTLDRVVTDSAGIDLKVLGPMTSMDEIVGYFGRIGHKFTRGRSDVDSAGLSTPLYSQFSTLVLGNPLIINNGTNLQIAAVQQVQNAPIGGADQNELAAKILRRQEAGKRLQAARKAAKIVYSADIRPLQK